MIQGECEFSARCGEGCTNSRWERRGRRADLGGTSRSWTFGAVCLRGADSDSGAPVVVAIGVPPGAWCSDGVVAAMKGEVGPGGRRAWALWCQLITWARVRLGVPGRNER